MHLHTMQNMAPRLLESLARIAPLSREAIDLFTDSAQVQVVKKGNSLLAEGQHCHHIWFIENGACRAFYSNGIKEINTGFFFENTFVTNLKSLRNNEPSEYNIQAMEGGVLWRWHKEGLFQLYRQSPEIAAFGRQWLEQLLIAQETHTHWLKKNSPEERYLSVLSGHPELIQRVSLTQLSSYLGISRETLSRIRHRLR